MAPMSKLNSFIPLFLMITLATTKLVQSQSVTTFAYDTFVRKPDPNELIYMGGAHVPDGSTFVRLTQIESTGLPASWSTGRVVRARPVRFWETSRQAAFETTIKFKITPSSLGAADGIAFFIAPTNTEFNQGSSGASFGIFNGPNGATRSLFAVEFDTNPNDWDPSYRHIGIDIESRTSRNTTRFDSATGQEVTARINYDANRKAITVVATSGTRTASVSYAFDLKTILPQNVQVGISASTGQAAAYLGVHDIISWYFTSSLVSDGGNALENDDTHIRQYV